MLYVEQEKPVTTKHEVLGDISFKVESPAAQNLDEAKTMAGGEAALVEFFNSQVATNSKNAARAYARGFEVAKDTPADKYPELIAKIAAKGQELAKNYSPASDTERGPSKAKKAAAFDQISQLMDSGKEFTREELFALLAAAK